jgi:hypothetical protein
MLAPDEYFASDFTLPQRKLESRHCSPKQDGVMRLAESKRMGSISRRTKKIIKKEGNHLQ